MNQKQKAIEILLTYYKLLLKTDFEAVKRCAEYHIEGIIHNCDDVDNVGYWSGVKNEIRYLNKSSILELQAMETSIDGD
jgi:excinuclease UvrABC nuclease subunit